MASSTVYAGEHSLSFRTLDENAGIEWEQGTFDSNGDQIASAQNIRSKHMMAIFEGERIRIEVPEGYLVTVYRYGALDDLSSYLSTAGTYEAATSVTVTGYYHVSLGKQSQENIAPSDGALCPVLIRREKNTWTEWHLIPTTRPVVAEAGVSTNFIEIPGRGDPVDLTDYLTGKPVYGPRSGSWEFIIDNYHEYWEAIRMRIVDFIHGKRLRVILSDIPTRYFEGRFTVGNLEPGENFSNITINYVLDVHSYSLYGEDEDWLWDPFNFDTDYTDAKDREGRL